MEHPRYAAPMVCLPNGRHVFIKDCVAFKHPDFDLTTRIVVKYMYYTLVI